MTMLTARITKVWRAVLGAQITEIEAAHAPAMLEEEREELRRRIAKYNRGLAGYAAISERLRSRIGRLEKEQRDLEARVTSRLEVGDRATAGRYAMRIEAIESELAQCASQLDDCETTYRELVRSRDVAIAASREKLEALKRCIGDSRVQESLADLSEMAAGMQGQLGLTDGTLERITERMEERRHYAAGRLRVARDSIDMQTVRAQEAEQEAMAEQALARFEARAESGCDKPSEGQ